MKRDNLWWMLSWGIMLMLVGSIAVLVITEISLHGAFAAGKEMPGWQFIFLRLAQAAITIALLVGLGAALYRKEHSKRTEKGKMDITRLSLLIRYKSLKQQVNPHTLFNTLNSLSALIPVDPVRAEKCVESMSLVYRYLLQDNSSNLVPFSRETTFIRSYLYLLEVRLGGALQISLFVSEGAQLRYIPPFALKLMVDDAVASNAYSMQNPLHICIATPADDRVVVRTSARLQKAAENAGLANVLECYRILQQPFVEIREEEGVFTVVLPLIKNATP